MISSLLKVMVWCQECSKPLPELVQLDSWWFWSFEKKMIHEIRTKIYFCLKKIHLNLSFAKCWFELCQKMNGTCIKFLNEQDIECLSSLGKKVTSVMYQVHVVRYQLKLAPWKGQTNSICHVNFHAVYIHPRLHDYTASSTPTISS